MFNNAEIEVLQGNFRCLEGCLKEFYALRGELHKMGLIDIVECGSFPSGVVGKVNMDKLLEALNLTLVKTAATEKYVNISK